MPAAWLVHLQTLQAHGLTTALLERFATHCLQAKSGQFIFHTQRGEIRAYEEHHKDFVGQLEMSTAALEPPDGRGGPKSRPKIHS